MFSKWCAVKEVANVCQKVFFKYESYQWGRNPILQLSFLIERDAKKKKSSGATALCSPASVCVTHPLLFHAQPLGKVEGLEEKERKTGARG